MPLSVVSFFSPFAFCEKFLSSSDDDLDFVEEPFAVGSVELSFATFSAAFLRFLLPGAFLSACVRPFSLSVFIRRFSRARSVGTVGRIGMTSFSAYGSLHCSC